MQETFRYYEKMKDEGDWYQYQMEPPVLEEDLENLESTLYGPLPAQYKEFLLQFDGGFICNGHWGEYIWETGNVELPQSRSIYFYSVAEIVENTAWLVGLLATSNEVQFKEHKVIPIASAPNENILFMKAESGSRVYNLEMYSNSAEVTVLYNDFRTFFKQYIKKDGYIEALF